MRSVELRFVALSGRNTTKRNWNAIVELTMFAKGKSTDTIRPLCLQVEVALPDARSEIERVLYNSRVECVGGEFGLPGACEAVDERLNSIGIQRVEFCTH